MMTLTSCSRKSMPARQTSKSSKRCRIKSPRIREASPRPSRTDTPASSPAPSPTSPETRKRASKRSHSRRSRVSRGDFRHKDNSCEARNSRASND